ncbi:MAG: tetratricopeptide repeat protein [Acidobacteria bacterium]|nr:tetratricopeptide repeat protein [Acidobacteriota bacterium]
MPTKGIPKRRCEEAVELTYDGWEILGRQDLGLRADLRQAEKLFREALVLNPDYADAHNGIGCIHYERGRYAEAEAMYAAALEKARADLRGDGVHEHSWWGNICTRPYMRARQGLGLTHWRLGKFEKAIEEFEELLKRNPSDNQGVRFLIGGAYHLRGKVRKALSLYVSAEESMMGHLDPDVVFNMGLALAQLRRHRLAIFQWRRSFFENLYYPMVVLNLKPRTYAIWHGCNTAELPHAVNYWEFYKSAWLRQDQARELLKLVYFDRDVQSEIASFTSLRARMVKAKDPRERGILLREEEILKDPKRIEGTNPPIVERALSRLRKEA